MAKTGGRKITAVTTTAAVKTAEITIAPIKTTAEAREAVTTTDMEILATAAATSPAEMGPRTARAEAAIMAAREVVKMAATTTAITTKTVEVATSTTAAEMGHRTARAEAAIMAAREAVKMVATTTTTTTKTVEADSTVAQGLNMRPVQEADSAEARHATRKTPAMEKRTCKRGNQLGGIW